MTGILGADLRERIAPYVASKHIAAVRHPTLPLTLYTYTHRTQHDRVWTPETRLCRGLILDDDGVVVARPFEKFYNAGEHEGVLPDEPFEVWEKLDGSLFLVCRYGDAVVTATRGSFAGEQAVLGRSILFDGLDLEAWARSIEEGATYCFELIAPENRIVVDYGGWRELVLLAVIDNATGRDDPTEAERVPMMRPKRYPGLGDDLGVLAGLDWPNAEGFVIHFLGESNLRLKVKFEEYVRLHKLVTGVNERWVWEALRAGTDDAFDGLLEKVPDEFGRWVRETAAALSHAYRAIEVEAAADYADIRSTVADGDRRSFAAKALACRYPAVLFAMLDGKDCADAIWKLIRPVGGRPFREDES